MKLFGLNITRAGESSGAVATVTKDLSPVNSWGSGWLRIFESYAGAWQQNVEINFDNVLAYHAVWACMTLIASDISKLRLKLVERDEQGIWSETVNPAYDPVLRKPNNIQNRIQFWESWILSKLSRGNTYVLKGRDSRGVVTSLHVLDPCRVTPLVSDLGLVFYDLGSDNLMGTTERIVVPAREIIHDRFNCVFHQLVGLSPIFASGLAATHGKEIQTNSTNFFSNRSIPGGILTAPGAISDGTALRLKTHWDTNYTGDNAGKVAVLGDGLKFEPITISAEDSQLIEQLRFTAEIVCSTFHVPPYKIGIGPLPSFSNIQALNIEYYSQCLQVLIEAAELCMDEGLDTRQGLGTEFDLDGLLRMDSVTQMTVLRDGIGAGVLAPNEARKKLDYKPTEGGESPYLQQQNYSLQALAKRDAMADPFGKASPPALPEPQQRSVEPELDDDMRGLLGHAAAIELRKSLDLAA